MSFFKRTKKKKIELPPAIPKKEEISDEEREILIEKGKSVFEKLQKTTSQDELGDISEEMSSEDRRALAAYCDFIKGLYGSNFLIIKSFESSLVRYSENDKKTISDFIIASFIDKIKPRKRYDIETFYIRMRNLLGFETDTGAKIGLFAFKDKDLVTITNWLLDNLTIINKFKQEKMFNIVDFLGAFKNNNLGYGLAIYKGAELVSILKWIDKMGLKKIIKSEGFSYVLGSILPNGKNGIISYNSTERHMVENWMLGLSDLFCENWKKFSFVLGGISKEHIFSMRAYEGNSLAVILRWLDEASDKNLIDWYAYDANEIYHVLGGIKKGAPYGLRNIKPELLEDVLKSLTNMIKLFTLTEVIKATKKSKMGIEFITLKNYYEWKETQKEFM